MTQITTLRSIGLCNPFNTAFCIVDVVDFVKDEYPEFKGGRRSAIRSWVYRLLAARGIVFR